MSLNSTDIGQWLGQFFNDVFFQPDDDLSDKAFEAGASLDVHIKINGQQLSFAAMKDSIIQARAQYDFATRESHKLLALQDEGESVGRFANATKFVQTDKKTGVQEEKSNVALITVGLRKGKMVLTEMIEFTT